MLPASTTQQRGAPFVGRARELEKLQEAFADARAGSVVVLVDGESGVGKSRLVKWFTDDVVANHPEAVVLAGRCYEREQLPYKALDGVIDALAGYLAGLPDDEVAELLPRRVGPLVQVFPVLRRSRAFAFARAEATRDPHELRRRAFAVLRQLLARLAAAHPLVIAIDDLQWADADSLLLLADVLRPPDAPPMLLVATVRDALIGEGSMTMSPVGVADVAGKLPCPVRNIHLTRLSDADAEELAGLLLAITAPDKLAYAATIAKEANGHPLFIDELARHAVLVRDRRIQPDDPDDTEVVVGPTFDLDAAIGARIARLDNVARDALELVAVAGRPLPQEVVARAAGVDMGAFAPVVARLRAAHLVHTSGARASDRIEVYHDRLRGAVLGRVAAGGRAACHKRLALALESLRSIDGEALSFHWAKAGDKARAAKFAAAAAHQATKALAFDRAAACWERALKLTPEKDVERQRKLRVRLGEALANAGRGALAAVIYARAADGAPAAQALELRRRAGEQYLRCGHFDEGIAAIREVLAAVDVSYPRSPKWALVQLVFLRLWLWLRGTRFRERDVSQLSARDLIKVDVCWSAAFGLGLSDHIYGAMFQARAVLCALRTGEPTRVARALSISASYRASAGATVWSPIERDLTRARALAERMRDMQSIAYSIAASGMSHYLAGHFRRGLIDCDRAAAAFRDKVPGAAWEQASMHFFSLSALWYLGDLAELCRRQPRYVRGAHERGDVYAAISVRVGYPNVVSLVRGDPAAARAEVRDAMAGWSKGGFHLEHMWEIIALTNADLYEGRGADALARIERHWAAMRKSMLLRVQSVLVMCLHARARAALAAAEAHARGSAERRRLLAIAARDARGLARERMAWTVPYGTLARAAVASLRGETDRAMRLLREAAAGFDGAEMALYASAARRQLAVLLERATPGSREARALRAHADAWMATQGVADPDALTAMVAPGFMS